MLSLWKAPVAAVLCSLFCCVWGQQVWLHVFLQLYLQVIQAQLWRKQTVDSQLGSNRTNGKRVEDIGKRSSEMIDN